MNKASNMSGAAIVAALSIAAVGVAAIWVSLDQQEMPDPRRVTPLIAAALCGGVAGYRSLARNLGGGIMRSGLFGVGAAIVAFLIFAGLLAIRSAYIYHSSVQFDSAKQALFHLIEAMVGTLQRAWYDPAPTAVLLIGGLLAGFISEFFNHIWRSKLH